jgi:hypothetical protein
MVTVLVVVALVMMVEMARRLVQARRAEAPVPVRVSTPRRMRRR